MAGDRRGAVLGEPGSWTPNREPNRRQSAPIGEPGRAVTPGPAGPTSTHAPQPRIADLFEVAAVETVMRLDLVGRACRLAELVLTGDVYGALFAVVSPSAAEAGAKPAKSFEHFDKALALLEAGLPL